MGLQKDVSADGLAPHGARASAGTVKFKFQCMNQEFEMFVKVLVQTKTFTK